MHPGKLRGQSGLSETAVAVGSTGRPEAGIVVDARSGGPMKRLAGGPYQSLIRSPTLRGLRRSFPTVRSASMISPGWTSRA